MKQLIGLSLFVTLNFAVPNIWILAEAKELTPEIELAPANKEIVKLTENGIVPPVVVLKKLDGSVFFVNTTKDSLATISIDFKSRRVHCASQNLKVEQDGRIHSIAPFGPKDFALTCFPDKGTYEFEVRGLKGSAQAVHGKVVVE